MQAVLAKEGHSLPSKTNTTQKPWARRLQMFIHALIGRRVIPRESSLPRRQHHLCNLIEVSSSKWSCTYDCHSTTAGTKPARLKRDEENKLTRTLTHVSHAHSARARYAIPERPCVIIVPNPCLNLAQSMLGENESQAICRFNGQKCYFCIVTQGNFKTRLANSRI